MPIDLDAYEDEWEDDLPSRPQKARSVGDLSVDAQARIGAYAVGRVVGVDRGRVMLLLDGEVVPGTYAGTMRTKDAKVVVGDEVRVRPAKHDNDLARVADRLERRTVLLRTPDDDVDDERVVVANADQAAVVIGVDHLGGGVGFADRVLVAASVGGLDGLVVVNKTDLLDTPRGATSEELARVVARFEAFGVPVVTTSAEHADGLGALRLRLAGVWTAFTGHSGVGKSSLFNLLVPEHAREVGEVGLRGGRHTTTSSLAVEVPGLADTWLADTPGVRSFGLGAVDPDDLHRHFPELADLDWVDAGEVGDPPAGRLAGRIAPDRLDTYRRLRLSLQGVDVFFDDDPVA